MEQARSQPAGARAATRRWRAWPFALTMLIIGLAPAAAAPPRYRHAIEDPLRQQKSPVWDVYSEFCIRGLKVNQTSLRAMITLGIKRLARNEDPNAAWREFIHDQDTVALVFNPVGARAMGTNGELALALVACLREAGFEPDRIMLVGLAESPVGLEGIRRAAYGWQAEAVRFGAGQDHLAAWLDEATAVINVPTIMDDNITGLRGALANLAWPLVKSPARWYLNGGDPFIPEICGLPHIRGKVRLHIGNALRILYQGGPEVEPCYLYEYAALLFSTDPVALDRVALELIRRYRRTEPMPAGTSDALFAPYLTTAYYLGLGYDDLNFIDYRRITPEGRP
jgi:hypothetical protein